MYGFYNKILKIDVTEKEFYYEVMSDEILKKTLGGKGLGTYLLMQENPVGVEPLSPDNIFVITPGPVTGTKLWSQSRFAVFSKSPATNGYFESYCGGKLAPKIKGCGVDAIIIKGKCKELSYLIIDENGVGFKDASEIRGKETFESEDHILEHSPQGAGAMVIGPAGENGVAFACIKADKWRSLGRGGMGAIMGSKNVKGIAFAGHAECPIANEQLLKDIIKQIAQKGRESLGTKVYQKYGTPMQVAVTNSEKCFPTRYWSSGYFEKWETLSADYMQKNFEVKRNGCPNCFLQCTKYAKVKNGRHKGLELDGPEFETIYAIGGLNAIEGLEEVAWLNVICDRLGMDTMSAGNISAFAVEAYKRGKIDFQIDYNQPDRVAELFKLIACNEGVGKILGRGIKHASEALGLEDIAIHVKGLEPAGYDPRVLKGMGLAYGSSARGACHLRATFYKAELSGIADPDQIDGKAKMFTEWEDRLTIFDTLILCRFYRDLYQWEELSTILKATTGMELNSEKMRSIAAAITDNTRRFNLREGLTPEEDRIPRRFFREVLPETKKIITENQMEQLINDYYKERGWNEKGEPPKVES